MVQERQFTLLIVGAAAQRKQLAELLQGHFVLIERDDGLSGAAALVKAARVDAVVIILAKGQELADFQQLHDDPEFHRLPVVFLAEQVSVQKMEESFSVGVFDIIPLQAGPLFLQARFARLRYVLQSNKNTALLQSLIRRAMKQEDPDQVFLHFLRYLGLMTEAERAYIFEGNIQNPYTWSKDRNYSPGRRKLERTDYVTMRKILNRLFARYGSLAIENVEQCLCADDEKKQFRRLGIRNIVAVPVEFHNRRLCVISLENVPARKLREVRHLLEQMVTPLIMMFANRNTVFHLRANSAIDQMTGTLNRNAFDRVGLELNPRESIGVLFADIDNLKKVNDESGHAWGDRLICDVAEALLRFRHGGNVFHIGGDEFVILWQGLTERQFQQMGRRLRSQLAERNLELSLGFYWAPDVRQGFDAVMDKADQEMYSEKQRHRLLEMRAKGEGRTC
ncbi:diguanylate cyclase [uncultured Megasphaera sp.]|uniref:GGDEF domain-containing protein n=1 Tax=uncultured Megasphaera sp. TaxID=165188 RepID=UPI0025959A82|nr:GGDEF domain-containing protein [uncultured Megasphaera sp.]